MNVQLKIDAKKIVLDAFEARFNPAKSAELAEHLAPMRALVEQADRRVDAYCETLLKGQTK